MSNVIDAIERMEQRQREREGTPTAPPAPSEAAQQRIPVAQALEALLSPGKEYNGAMLLSGVGMLKELSDKVFGMSIPDTCAALSFLTTAWNRTSRFKGAPFMPPVPVPAVPEKQDSGEE